MVLKVAVSFNTWHEILSRKDEDEDEDEDEALCTVELMGTVLSVAKRASGSLTR